MNIVPRRMAINTGGGFVSGLNAVVAGAVMAGYELGIEVVGIRDGYEGLLFPDRYPEGGLTRLSNESVDGILRGGAAVLGASRVNPFQVREIADGAVEEIDRSGELLEATRKQRIDGVISVTSRSAMGVALKLERKGLKTLCVPESVENDVADTTLSFGFNTALGFTIELLDRIRAGAHAAQKIAVVEVLGEHTGWLALQAGMATLADAILIPEVPYDLDRVAQRLGRDGRRPALVVVAEGARAAKGNSPETGGNSLESMRRALSPGSSAEGTGNGRHVIRLSGAASEAVAPALQRLTNIETFFFVLDQVLRGGQITAVDRQAGLAYGAAAVRGLHDGHSGEMVAFQPPHLAFVPLAHAVNKVRTVPADSEFIQAARALGICLGN